MPLAFDTICPGFHQPRPDGIEGDGTIADGAGLLGHPPTSPITFKLGIDSIDPAPLSPRITSLAMTPQNGHTVCTKDDRAGQLFTANVEQ